MHILFSGEYLRALKFKVLRYLGLKRPPGLSILLAKGTKTCQRKLVKFLQDKNTKGIKMRFESRK